VIRIGFVRSIVHSGASADGAGLITTAPAGRALHDGKRRRGLWLREKARSSAMTAGFPSQVSHATGNEFRGLVNLAVSAYATPLGRRQDFTPRTRDRICNPNVRSSLRVAALSAW
jgi:hypothetical protein